jgi:hypothetical protein
MTPASTSTIYAVVNSSNNVYYTHGFTPGNTATFTTLTSPYSGNISDIKIDHKNKDHFWITYSGYGTVHIAEYKSGSWSTPNINLPDVPVHCIEVDTSNNYMYVGTDIGVYYLDTTTKQWEVFNNASAMPSIEVSDLGISYKKKELWASTYGRGLWKSALQSYTVPPDTSDTSTYVHIIPYTNKLFNIFPNPNNGVFTVKTEAPDLANKSLAIRIIDANGKTVWKNNVRTNESGLMQINTFGLPGGIYTFDVADKQYSLGRCRLQIE